MATAPAARRAILDLILEDPDRVLEESFEPLAQRAGSSVPTVMRTCRDLGFAGLREFKLALAHELALGGSPLHRRASTSVTRRRHRHQSHAQRRHGGQRGCSAARPGRARGRGRRDRAARAHVDRLRRRADLVVHGDRSAGPPVQARPVGQCLGRLPPAARGRSRPGRAGRGGRDLARRRPAVAARRGGHRPPPGGPGRVADTTRNAAGRTQQTCCSRSACPTTR